MNSKTNGVNFTENWLPVRQIMNGMIQLDDGTYVTGVKVMPKNIFIMDQGSQNNTIYQLRDFYNSIDYDFCYLLLIDLWILMCIYLNYNLCIIMLKVMQLKN